MTDLAAFRLDPVNQCLWRRGDSGEYERVLLTPTEYSVLDHLVEHAGRLVTHRELLDAVWPRTAIEPQAVKSKIFHLRRLFDDDPKQPRFIETLPRRGYRFVGSLERGVVDSRDSAVPKSPLVGRDRALDLLQQHMRGTLAGKLQLVFITGEPGIGKTALVDEFGRLLAASHPGTHTVRGQCVEGFGSKEPFYPVLEAIGELCRRPDGAKLVEHLASHAPTWLVQFPGLLTPQHRETLRQEILGATRERMLREICDLLETTGTAAPLLLVLEDLHWADSSTLDLISALARRRVSANLMIVGTYRPSDVARSAQPLHALKRDLVARQLCHEIVLQPLNVHDIARYLASGETTAADVPEELARVVHRHTEGNPLFMIAVLEHLGQRGFVERERNVWRMRRPASDIAVDVPDSLRQMISAQIEQLNEQEQRVLEVAAIAGMTFSPAICASISDLDTRLFEECCETLARRAHIIHDAGVRELPNGDIIQRFAFVHALYREVLYERQSPARRAMLHRRRAARLEEAFADALDEVTGELAHHFEKGGDWSRAVKYLRHAAELAALRYALEDARLTLHRALALTERLPATERAASELAILDTLGGLDVVTTHPSAVQTLTLLRERAAHYDVVDAEVKALIDVVLPLSRTDGRQALEAIERALQLSEAHLDPLKRASARAACMMRRIATRGWSDDDAQQCAEAMEDIRCRGTKIEVALHAVDSSFVELFSSRYRKAQSDARDGLRVLMEGHEASTYLDFAVAHWNCDTVVPWSLNFLGEWGEALRDVDARIVRAERNADLDRTRMLQLLRAWIHLNAQDFDNARAICQAALPDLGHPSATFLRRLCMTIAGAAEAGAGNHSAALDMLLAARDEMNERMVVIDWYRRSVVEWALTNLWLSRGDLSRAREEGELLLASANATAERTWQALAWETNARIALASGALPDAQRCIDNALTAIEGFEAPVAAWQAHATAAEIARLRSNEQAAAHHRRTSRAVVSQLAESFGADQAESRQTFLSATAVTRTLAGETVA